MEATQTISNQPDALDWLNDPDNLEPPAESDIPPEPSDYDLSPDLVPNFPRELKAISQWVLWKLTPIDGGRLTKIPFQTVVKDKQYLKAASDDPSTWTTFDAACSKLTAISSEKGIGFQLGVDGCGYLFLDFDGCRNPRSGEVAKWAEDFLIRHRTYTEISPSGEGLRAIYKGQPQLPNGSGTWKLVSPKFPRMPGVEKTPALELFTYRKYVTVTGNTSGPSLRDIAGYDGFLPELEALVPASTATAPTDAEILKTDLSDSEKFKILFAGKWQEARNIDGNPYPSMSEAATALCIMLAYKHGNDAAVIDAEFRTSQFYKEYPKWDRHKNRSETYGEYFIKHAIGFAASHPPTDKGIDEPSPDASVPEIPVFPLGVMDGNYIGELTRSLTEHTSIPPVFVYNNLKCILGSILDGRIGFPNHPDLHLRQYVVNVSLHPRTGKGVAWKRTGDTGSYLRPLMDGYAVTTLDGGKIGSGEFFVKLLKGCEREGDQNNRSDVIARFDEMAEVFNKAQSKGSTIETKLLQLYERNEVAQGSFKNGEHDVKGIHFSLSGDFTRSGFAKFFSGAGSIGSGFLARCTFGYADKSPIKADWLSPNHSDAESIVKRISARIDGVSNPALRMTPVISETPEARELRLAFIEELSHKDPHFTPEIEGHFKRDLLFRAMFSDANTVTPETVRQSVQWAEYQYAVRETLWPVDAGTLEAQMEVRITKALQGRQLSARDLQRYAHVERPETGGYEVFNRALKALTIGGVVKVAGQTRKHQPIYAASE